MPKVLPVTGEIEKSAKIMLSPFHLQQLRDTYNVFSKNLELG